MKFLCQFLFAFDEVHFFIPFTYYKEKHYTSSRLDLYGKLEGGYNGHASIILENSHILLCGGSDYSYDPINVNVYKKIESEIPKRLKLLNVFYSYKWEIPIVGETEEKRLNTRTGHVMVCIKFLKFMQVNILFIHGGEHEGNIMGNYLLYDLDHNEFLPFEHDNTELRPQLKGHAASYIIDIQSRFFDVIITGGILKVHTANCEIASGQNNVYKDKCLCVSITISDEVYGFRNGAFFLIQVKNKKDLKDRLKRFGHCMLKMSESEEDQRIIMLGGFIQNLGYVIDLLILNPIKNMNSKSYDLEVTPIKLELIPGRIYPTCQMIKGRIILFGGLADKKLFNDIWIIETREHEWTSIQLQNDPNYIYPRLGMSSCIFSDSETQSRILIYGGSYTHGKSILAGVTNEIIVIDVKVRKYNYKY